MKLHSRQKRSSEPNGSPLPSASKPPWRKHASCRSSGLHINAAASLPGRIAQWLCKRGSVLTAAGPRRHFTCFPLSRCGSAAAEHETKSNSMMNYSIAFRRSAVKRDDCATSRSSARSSASDAFMRPVNCIGATATSAFVAAARRGTCALLSLRADS